MSDKPKRRFWQIHLSTAVALMVVVAVLMLLNTAPKSPRIWQGLLYTQQEMYVDDLVVLRRFESRRYGWPMLAYPSTRSQMLTLSDGTEFVGIVAEDRWDAGCITVNVLIGALLLYFTARFCEIRIRRREARK